MPPPPDPNTVVYLNLRVVGGEIPSGASISPKIGPLGLPAKKVGEDISKATAHLKGLRVFVRLRIQNRQATVEVVPTASCLLIHALKEAPRDRKKVKKISHHGNMSLNDLIEASRKMRYKSYAKNLKGTAKELLGTANSFGCTINRLKPMEMIAKINSGEIDIPDE